MFIVKASLVMGDTAPNQLLHETRQVSHPYNSSSREQVTTNAFTAPSYMKVVPLLGSPRICEPTPRTTIQVCLK